MFRSLSFLLALTIFTSCTTPRVKIYRDALEPMIGNYKKDEVNRRLGAPSACKTMEGYEECEYRTALGRNEPTPDIHRKDDGFGIDLSPYEHFDVIHVYYDDIGVVKDWTPVVIKP